MPLVATYAAVLVAALVASVFAIPAIWIPCVVAAALLVLRLELLWALGKLVRIKPISLEERLS
jgi:hypothetical protein